MKIYNPLKNHHKKGHQKGIILWGIYLLKLIRLFMGLFLMMILRKFIKS